MVYCCIYGHDLHRARSASQHPEGASYARPAVVAAWASAPARRRVAAGKCRLQLIDDLAEAGLELGAAVDLVLQIPDTEIAIAALSPRYALLASNGACFASHPALLVSERMTRAIFVNLSALVAQVEKGYPDGR